MHVPERWPYAGKLAFTAFSGSHQDAINKGHEYMRESKTPFREIPYLPIDPADVGREYEPIIRINSQSGKGGAAFIMDHNYGYHMPKAMHPEFGAVVQAECDRTGRELTANEVYELFHREFLNISGTVCALPREVLRRSDCGQRGKRHPFLRRAQRARPVRAA